MRVKKLLLPFVILACAIMIVPVNAARIDGLYEPGVIYKRYNVAEKKMELCRINVQTGMDEKSVDDGKTWSVVGGDFNDAAGAWCENEIKICYESGIIKGISNSKFNPTGIITNAQVLAIMARLRGYWQGQQGIYGNKQADIPWYIQYKEYLEENGVLIPDSLVDSPQSACTRYNFTKALCAVTDDRNLEKINEIQNVLDSTDLDVRKLYEAGILFPNVKSELSFEGNREVTRGAAAAIIARLVDTDLRKTF